MAVTTTRPAPLLLPAVIVRSPATATVWPADDQRWPTVESPPDFGDQLVVLLSGAGESGWRRAQASEASSRGVRWIDLVLEPGVGVRLGPLSRADWSVCTACAEDRIDAVRGGSATEAGLPSELVELAAALLDLHLPAVRDDVDGTGPFRRHVLTVDAAATVARRSAVVASVGCSCCPGPVPTESENTAFATDLPGLLTRLDGWVGPVTGVIPTLRLDRPLGDGPGLPTVVTAEAPRIRRNDELLELPVGWGKGLGDGPAVLSAVGEAIERYSASLPDPHRLVWARMADLDGTVLDPATFGLYAADQYVRPDFTCARWDPELVHPWVRGRWHASADPVWVPAVFAYLRLAVEPHQRIVQGSSNGLAAGSSVADAADRAVLELIERDALLTAWRCGGALRRLDPASVDATYQLTLDGLRRLGVTVELAAVGTAVGVPTVMAVGRADGDRLPGACIGLACAHDPARAAGGAILELAQTLPHLTALHAAGRLPVPDRAEDVRTMLDHAAWFWPAERAATFDRLYSPEPALTIDDLVGPTRPLADALAGAGIRMAVVDVSAVDVATGPFRVVRAVSPDLTTLSFGWGMDRQPPHRVRNERVLSPPPPVHPVW